MESGTDETERLATHADYLELPEAIRRAVGSASQLCQWALMDRDSLPVIMSNFMRSYKTAVTEQRERGRIQKDVLALMAGKNLLLMGFDNREAVFYSEIGGEAWRVN